MIKQVNIVEDFHPYPAGRYVEDGGGNGTSFREKFILPTILTGEDVEITLDGAPGYPSSFLEEAFGGLVRAHVPAEVIRQHLKFKASKGYERYVDKIWAFIEKAQREAEIGPSAANQ